MLNCESFYQWPGVYYSDWFIADIRIGFGWAMSGHRYGEWWRRHRRAMHEKFHPSAVEEYKPIQIKHTKALLRRLLREPASFMEHLRHAAGAMIMEVRQLAFILRDIIIHYLLLRLHTESTCNPPTILTLTRRRKHYLLLGSVGFQGGSSLIFCLGVCISIFIL